MTSDDDDDDYFVVVLGLIIITSPIKDQFIVLASASLRLPYLYVLYLTDAVPILVVMQSSTCAHDNSAGHPSSCAYTWAKEEGRVLRKTRW